LGESSEKLVMAEFKPSGAAIAVNALDAFLECCKTCQWLKESHHAAASDFGLGNHLMNLKQFAHFSAA
jgi:hypothetical protein